MAAISVHKPLHCPLCFKNFTTPRVLPCYHTFCEKCLGTHIESQVQDETKFMCPLCAASPIPDDSKLAVGKWASAFPLNTLICSVLESSGPQEMSDNCELCKTDCEITKAEFWCRDCCEKMCGSCKTLHKRIKQMKHHFIVPFDEMDQNQHHHIHFDQECCLHHDKVKLFCVDHRELCCAVCVDTNHDKCKNVRTIDDIASDQSQRFKSDYHTIIWAISKLKKGIEKVKTEKENNRKEVLEEKMQIINDMDTRIDGIIERLNKARNIFRNDTERLYKQTEESMLKSEEKVQSFMTNVQNFSEILEIMKKNGTTQQQFTTFENFRRQISSHYCQLKLHLKDDSVVHYAVNQSKVLNDLEETLDFLGTVEVLRISSTLTSGVLLDTDKILKNLDSCTKIRAEMCAAQVEKPDSMTSPVKFVKAVKGEKLENQRWFTGGTYTVNDRLVMADYNNNSLVELDNEYNMVEEYYIDGEPSDVAAGNKDNEIYIAVDFDVEKYIYKCTLHTDLTIVSRIKAPSGTWGIAVSGDNIIVGTRDAVVILTQDGSTVRSTPKSGYNSFVAVSQTQRTIYHRDNNDVVCRTWEGQEVFRYQHPQLEFPCGIIIDSDRNVYICGNFSHNLHQVSSDGQRSRIIQLHSIPRPYGVVVHPQKKELVVTSSSEGTACEVYRLG